jgi:hypothetical protein
MSAHGTRKPDPRIRRVHVRVSSGEERVLREAAARSGLTLSALIRAELAASLLTARAKEKAHAD